MALSVLCLNCKSELRVHLERSVIYVEDCLTCAFCPGPEPTILRKFDFVKISQYYRKKVSELKLMDPLFVRDMAEALEKVEILRAAYIKLMKDYRKLVRSMSPKPKSKPRRKVDIMKAAFQKGGDPDEQD